MARVVLVVLASLLVASCGQLDSLLGRQEQRWASPEKASNQGSSPTTPKFDPKGVGDTAEVGPFLVTLNPSAAPGGGDIDCGQVDGPIYVGPVDPHNLDGDGDGYACE